MTSRSPSERILRNPETVWTYAPSGLKYEMKVFPGNPERTPIVLIHGLLSSIHFWYERHLEPFHGHPVYAISLPGHFPSQPLEARQRIDSDFLVQESLAQIEALIGNRQCLLVGHSTGASLALLLAARFPGRFRAVLSIAGAESGKEEGGIYRFLQEGLRRFGCLGKAMVYVSLMLNCLDERLHRIMAADVAADGRQLINHPDFSDYLRSYFPAQRRLCPHSMARFFEDLLHWDIRHELGELRVPTWLLSGDQDPLVSQKRSRQLAAMIPGSYHHVFRNSGHMPMFEQPDQYSQTLSKFVRLHA